MMKQWLEIFSKYEEKYGTFLKGIKETNYELYVANIIANAGMLPYSEIENYEQLLNSKMLKRRNNLGDSEGFATLSKKGIKELVKELNS